MKLTKYLFVLLSVIAGFLGGIVGTAVGLEVIEPSEEKLIRDWYAAEVAVLVSPHHLRKHLADDDFILVDLRSQEEYKEAHISGAINIPAYVDPDTSAYGDVERIVNAFSALPQDRDIIVYCYSMPCMTGRKIGNMLAEHKIYVRELGIGWNEWRYFWELWNHEHEWDQTDPMDYISSGTEEKTFSDEGFCPIDNEFGC